MRVRNGTVFAVAGSKGGVGKTTTSINLSAILTEMGYDVVLVEMDLAMANVGDFLDIDVGLEGEDPTLHEVLAGTSTVIDATYDSPCDFDVVPSGARLRGFRDADVGVLPDVLATLRFAYDVIVLDTGAGVTRESLVPIALADETILVSSPRVAAVRDTMKTRDLARQVGGSVAGVVFVKSGTGRSPSVDHIADFLSVDLLGHIPEDSAVADAQDVGRPVVVAARGSEAAEAYRDLGERIAERIDVLGTSSSAVLTADSVDRDGSGFAFVDRPDEADDGDHDDDTDGSGEDEADATDEADAPDEGETNAIDEVDATDDSRDRASADATPRATVDRGNDDPVETQSGRPDGDDLDARADTARDPDDVADDGSETIETADVVDGTGTAVGPDAGAPTSPTDTTPAPDAVEPAAGSGIETTATHDTDSGTETAGPEADTTAGPEADTTATPDPTTPGIADGGRTDAATSDGESERSDTSGSTQSATERLIDRARRLVDRRAD
ncbi:P-loop NTPase [Salinigranum sp. GCM10025319]|uniref:P-loop NTPase n=1 Tax=Salinigranum sp. GCM10025319 TaxID=3252687 RepID=UPI00361C3125